ncbi:MAG: Asp-tRNA(Asn)/Glu-tRNA(Gln) amidotransferase subunit GatC [Candidatus Fonsibacter sp.]|nr:Asp-tRNA(Asn)/Glu-tRNA(Gln) amidotransferase subunit GatC [Pelagibacterales bacterium]
MSINKDTIKKISKLARISVTNEETDRLEKDLNSILKFVEQLKKLNTDKITPIASVSDQLLTMSEDEVKKINEKKEILQNAPDKNTNYYIVPKVIE